MEAWTSLGNLAIILQLEIKRMYNKYESDEIINRKKVPLKTKEIALGLLTNTKNNINTFRRLKND